MLLKIKCLASLPHLIKRMILPNSKFRIVCRDSKFVPQEFFGVWYVGLYPDIAKEFNLSDYLPYQFEHENIFEAGLVIELTFAHHQTPDGVSGTKGAYYAEIAGSQIAIVQVKGDQ
jgi:hypothetical protein